MFSHADGEVAGGTFSLAVLLPVIAKCRREPLAVDRLVVEHVRPYMSTDNCNINTRDNVQCCRQ